MVVPGECQIWWADRALARPHLLDVLDDTERERWRRFRLEQDRQRYLTAHALIRRLAGRRLETEPAKVVFEAYCSACGKTDHGKPRVAGRLEFSIAHSGRWSVVAIALDRPVGVDVEELRQTPRDPSLADQVLSRPERAGFSGGERELVTYWSRKEALLKATGEGLAVAPDRITVSAPDRPPRLISWEAGREARFALYDLQPDPRHVGCLAVEGGTLKITEHHAAPLLL